MDKGKLYAEPDAHAPATLLSKAGPREPLVSGSHVYGPGNTRPAHKVHGKTGSGDDRCLMTSL